MSHRRVTQEDGVRIAREVVENAFAEQPTWPDADCIREQMRADQRAATLRRRWTTGIVVGVLALALGCGIWGSTRTAGPAVAGEARR